MRLFFSYLILQWKRCFKTLLKLLLTILAAMAVFCLIAFLMIRILSSNETISLAKIGVVIPEEESVTEYLTSFIESMDSVKSVCRFEYLSEDEAMTEYAEGELNAVVVIPEGFFHDVQVGLNPPALIYFPKDASLAESLFKEVMVSGVSYLQTAEAGVYAAIDTAYVYTSDMSIADIGNALALQYVSEVLSRDKMFKTQTVSALGELSVISYYFIAGTIIILMFSGISYRFMYGSNYKAVDDKLRVNGLNRILCFLLKILAMTPYIYITGLILYFMGVLISTVLKTDFVVYSPAVLGYMAIIALTLAIYFELIYEITGSGKSGVFVLIIINVIGACVSGLIIPSAYMSSFVARIGNVLPMKWWVTLLAQGIFKIGGML